MISYIRRFLCVRCLVRKGWTEVSRSIYTDGARTVVVGSDGSIYWR